MRILTKENASEMLGGKPLDAFITQLSSQLQLVEGSKEITAPNIPRWLAGRSHERQDAGQRCRR
jgi:hypothetical protein